VPSLTDTSPTCVLQPWHARSANSHAVCLQVFIFMTGIFVSSWIGGALLSVGEWIIKKLPLIKHIYSAAKQVR